jgi:hypothetical protein
LINSLSSNSILLNSQTQLNNHSTSLPCTVSRRSQKLNNNDDLLTTNSLVQTTTTARNNKISNGNNDDDSSSTYKQQKKQLIKSSNTQNTQSRRQQKKQETREQIRPTSRDSSASYNNGFATNSSIENSDIDKKYNARPGLCSSCRMLTEQNSEFCRLMCFFPLNSAGVYRILPRFLNSTVRLSKKLTV